jgi:cytochrome c-type protein NapC
VTKYVPESRTALEIQSRDGEKKGGWSKLKPEGDIDALMKAQTYMDLLRFRSGAPPENGHVLAERSMTDPAIVAEGKLEGGVWTVTMSRPLTANAPGDLSIEPGKLYTVGFALHDDHSVARFHHVSLEYRMGIDVPDAEIKIEKR